MIYLFGQLLFSIVFIQGMRYAQIRHAKMALVAAINYLIAAVMSLLFCFWPGEVPASFNLTAIGLGAANGMVFFLAFFVQLAAYRIAGTGISIALASSSVIVPVVVAHLLWPTIEWMSTLRWLAVLLIPVAMYLMRPNHSKIRRLTLKADGVLLLLFVMAGLANLFHKLVTVFAEESSHPQYRVGLFAAAALGSGVWALMQCKWPNRLELSWGLVLGTSNALALVLVLLGLGALGAVVFFTTSGPLVIILTLVTGRMLWREQITRRQGLGICAAIMVVVLTNLPVQ